MEATTITNELGLPVHTFPLVRPRTVGGVRHATLSMVEPHIKANMKLADLLAEAEAVTDQIREITMLSILCDVPVALIEILHPVDYRKLQELLQNFPSPEEETSGETSSASPA